MATATPITTDSDRREFLIRLQTLIFDEGTQVLRNILDKRLQNQPLNVVLESERSTIEQLQRQNTITTAQIDRLYPGRGQLPDTSNFDITLIVCLIRHLHSLGCNQNYNWNVPPQTGDTSVEADVCRLKGFRNEIAHISSTTAFQYSSFETKWNEIKTVLLRLDQQSPTPNFSQRIDSYKYSPMDPANDIITPSQEQTEKAAKKAYVKMKSNLQDDLILFYKHQHKTITLSPLMEEDQPLLKFYQMPDIQSVTRSRDGDKPEKTPVKTLRDVFYKENKLCSNIYLTADAGYGKTAFSKKLALAWCHAMKPDKSEEKHFSRHDITVMGGFSFVFVVLLRDSSSECDIDKLILNQICSQLAHKHKYTEENVADILCEETCLVILDGLDEWTHPLNSCRRGESNIPHQAVRENVAILTTTRPWKLGVSGLHSSQIDQKLELEGLSDDSAKKLKRSMISHLHRELDESKIDKYETDFNMNVQKKHSSDLTAIPLFLIYFLLLWFGKMNVGKSLADLYSSFLELLLSRTVKKETKTETVQGNIPSCFNKNTLCKQFYTLLTTLGKLAFYSLFSETKENKLVFDGCIAEKYLSKDELTFCLKTGILTQSKVQGASLLQQKTKVSFAHKTVQEYLAALYINSGTDQKSKLEIKNIVLSKCKCVKDILDMSKIVLFIVSIGGKFSLLLELMKIINEDEITQEYRRSLQGDYFFFQPLKDLQDMYISCCKESLQSLFTRCVY